MCDLSGGGSEASAPSGAMEPSEGGAPGPGPSAPESRSSALRQRLTDERRREILLRLVTDRRARRSPTAAGADAGGPGSPSGRGSALSLSREERQERVQQLLAERERSLSYDDAGGSSFPSSILSHTPKHAVVCSATGAPGA